MHRIRLHASIAVALAFLATQAIRFPVVLHAATTLISSVSAGSANGNTVSTPAADNSTCTTNCLITCWVADLQGTTQPTVTDGTNTYTRVSATYERTAAGRINTFYKVNATVSSSMTFSVSNTTTYPSLACLSWNNAHATAALDDTDGGSTAGADPWAFGQVDPTQDGEVVTSAISWEQDTTPSVSGFTVEEHVAFGPGTHFAMNVAYQIQTTATSRTPSWDFDASRAASGENNTWKTAAAASGCGRLSLLGVGC